MKRIFLGAGGLALALTLAACGQKTGEQAPAANEAAASTVAAPAGDSMAGMNMASPQAGKTAKGKGTVTAIDPAAGSITVNHEPIPEARWPAMTMAFRATSGLAQSVRVGDKVAFDLKLENGGGEITAIQKQ